MVAKKPKPIMWDTLPASKLFSAKIGLFCEKFMAIGPMVADGLKATAASSVVAA